MRVAVIGGGLQGCCVALELERRGVQVDLYEARDSIMEGASRHSEGKIHLGFVYANDPSLRTASLQARGASVFAPLMRRWLGPEFDQAGVSTPFNYVVHRDSLIPADRLGGIYQAVGQQIHEFCRDGAYFGAEKPETIERLTRAEVADYGESAQAVFATQELAVDPDSVADLISKRIVDASGIVVALRSPVSSVEAGMGGLKVTTRNGQPLGGQYDHVVNCAWEGRLLIDQSAGLAPRSAWTFRMKYFVRASHPRQLLSSTIVLGPFGDVVQYPNGDQYLSWYPTGRRGWSAAISPPEWPTRPRSEEAADIATGILDHISSVVPAVRAVSLSDTDVRGGVIFALGTTDVDDPASRFHQRSEVGVTTVGERYHTIDTGKYTTAPLFAVETADRITGPMDT